MPTNNSLVKFEYITKNHSLPYPIDNDTIYFLENNGSIHLNNQQFCAARKEAEIDGHLSLTKPLETSVIIEVDALEDTDYLILQGENSNPIVRNVHDPLNAQDVATKNYVDNKLITDFNGVLTIQHGGTGNSDGYIRAGAAPNSTIGQYATAEGNETTASGDFSHAGGLSTITSGRCSYSEGWANTASGDYSHCEGDHNIAFGNNSHVEGCYTNASGAYQHVFGTYNIIDENDNPAQKTNYIEIVGNGFRTPPTDLIPSIIHRSNARVLDWAGNEILAGKLTIGATPTADMDVTNKSYVDALKPLIVTFDNTTSSKTAAEIFAAIPDRSVLCLYNSAYYPMTYCSATIAEFGYYNGTNDSAKISIDANGDATFDIQV